MTKGINLEVKLKAFLQSLFEGLGFSVLEARQQTSGTQHGFDIRITFLDASEKKREFYFECKDYTSPLPWKEMLRKIHELHAFSHPVDGFIGISPRRNLSNINTAVQHTLPNLVKFPVRFWTPDAHVKEYLSLDKTLFQEIYSEPPPDTDPEKIKQKLQVVINTMLRERDDFLQATAFPKDLTLKIPRIHIDDIVGRADELHALHQALFQNKQVVLVNGLGGIGKTTLAQGYISRYYLDYQHVAWITQKGTDITQDITQDEGLLRSLSVSQAGKDVQQLLHEILYKFKTISGKPNLLVLDNADRALTNLKDMFPGQPDWHLLVTSRERMEGFLIHEIGFLSPATALELFKKHYNRTTDDTKLYELLEVVDYHTLTLEILAKTAQLQRVDIDALKFAIEHDLRANVYVAHKGDKVERVRSYLSSIFTLSQLTKNEVWLIKYFECLPAEYHSYSVLLALIAPGMSQHEAVFSETLTALSDHGWLLYNSETDSYKMHRIITEVAVRKLPIALVDVEPLVDSVSAKLQFNQFEEHPVEKFPWIPFGKTLTDAFSSDMSEKIAHLRLYLAMVLHEYGDYTGARTVTEQAIATFENLGEDVDFYRSQGYACLGNILRSLGDYTGAIRWLEKAIALEEHYLGINDPRLSKEYACLAMVFNDLGRYSTAKRLLEKCVLAAENEFGEYHAVTGNRYSKLGHVLLELGDHSGAHVLFEKALRATEKHLGPNHPDLATQYSDIATTLQNRGDYVGAVELLRKSVASTETNFGPDHPSMARDLSNLASALRDAGNYGEAKVLYEKALEIAERSQGQNHPDTVGLYSNLGTLLHATGDYDNAKRLLEKAVFLGECTQGRDHPSLAKSIANLASVQQTQGEFAGAKKLYKTAIKLSEKKLGVGHPHTAILYANLSSTLVELDEFIQAKELLEKAIRSDEENFGPDHVVTTLKYANLAALLHHLGDYDTAQSLLERVIRSNEEILGKAHPTVAMHYSNLGSFLHQREDYTGAKALLEKAVASDEKNLGEDHPVTARKYANLGMVLGKLGDHAGASRLLEKAIAIGTKHLGEDHVEVVANYIVYAHILIAMNDAAGAKSFLEKATRSHFKRDRTDLPPGITLGDQQRDEILAMLANVDGEELNTMLARLDIAAKQRPAKRNGPAIAFPAISPPTKDYDAIPIPNTALQEEDWGDLYEVDKTALSWLNKDPGALALLGEQAITKATLGQVLAFIELKFGIDEKTLSWHYINLAEDLCNAQNFACAKEVLKRIIARYEQQSDSKGDKIICAYQLLSLALCATGDYHELMDLFEKMITSHNEHTTKTIQHYIQLSNMLKNHGQHASAKVIQKKVQWAKQYVRRHGK
ncbi:tetratricopeptide repeat protein [Fulvivirgaceae bacterium PWU5]|uniref:Tetratricopeptide repeat protein n=1 Tax=Dawidia cretensis TaxID=2782350 RepID=A0AAP2GWS8_9BACT|nr:tetratricopeptide repeat protein [Dawidia cretensis]MBT1711312.1 tetratricopeptide repeat protein [Dawidia cretensis]